MAATSEQTEYTIPGLDWSAVPEAFVTTAVREGKLLYEREG